MFTSDETLGETNHVIETNMSIANDEKIYQEYNDKMLKWRKKNHKRRWRVKLCKDCKKMWQIKVDAQIYTKTNKILEGGKSGSMKSTNMYVRQKLENKYKAYEKHCYVCYKRTKWVQGKFSTTWVWKGFGSFNYERCVHYLFKFSIILNSYTRSQMHLFFLSFACSNPEKIKYDWYEY